MVRTCAASRRPRRPRFGGGRDAVSSERAPYAEGTLKGRLTWQNSGYRLGVLFDTGESETDPGMVDEIFEWCARRYRDLTGTSRRRGSARRS